MKTLAKVAAVPAQDVTIDQVDCDASVPRRVHVWVSFEVLCPPMRAARIIGELSMPLVAASKARLQSGIYSTYQQHLERACYQASKARISGV